jgi:hypothetical protein
MIIKNHKIRIYRGATMGADAMVPKIGNVEIERTEKTTLDLVRNHIERISRKYRNDATAVPSAADLAALQALYALDVELEAEQIPDISAQLFTEVMAPQATQTVKIREMLPYVGEFGEISGSNDSVPLMEMSMPVQEELTLKIEGFGWKDSMREHDFNPFFDVNRVLRGAAIIVADKKNAEFANPVLNATYDAAHSQAADTTGATRDLKIYNTLKAAYKKAVQLIHPILKIQLGTMKFTPYLICNPIDDIDITPIVKGVIDRSTVPQNMSPLAFTILQYGGGTYNGFPYGKKTISQAGVPMGYLYLKTEFGAMRVIKRDTSLSVGTVSVLQLSTDILQDLKDMAVNLAGTPENLPGMAVNLAGTPGNLPDMASDLAAMSGKPPDMASDLAAM